MSISRATVNRYGLKHPSTINGPTAKRLAIRLAGFIDAAQQGKDVKRVHKKLIGAAQLQGFVDEHLSLTPRAHAWRATFPLSPAAYEDICGRRQMNESDEQKKRFRNYRFTKREAAAARVFEFLAAGDRLLLVHPKLVDDLSAEELALWLKAKRHERDGLTLAQLAALLGEPVDHVRIRAERIRERGYAVAIAGDRDGANEGEAA